MCAAKVSHYFLEKSRICIQNDGETNFYIFHMLINKAPSFLKKKLYLDKCNTFAYLMNDLKQSNACTTATQSFDFVDKALSNLGHTTESKNLIYDFLAAILHIGNIQIEKNNNEYCEITKSSVIHLKYAANLLKIDAEKLKDALLANKIGYSEDM